MPAIPQIPDPLVYVLKYTGSLFSALYGVYATLTDFHVTENGRRTLSRKGYLGLCLLLASTLLNMSTDGLKDIRERRASKVDQNQRKEMLDQQRLAVTALKNEGDKTEQIASTLGSTVGHLTNLESSVHDNATLTGNVLSETERNLDPLRKDFRLSVTIMIDSQPALSEYLNRISAYLHPAHGLATTATTQDLRTIEELREWAKILPDQSEYPRESPDHVSETAVAILANIEFVTLDFYRGAPNPLRAYRDPDLAISMLCNPQPSEDIHNDGRSFKVHREFFDRVVVSCKGSNLKYIEHGNKFASLHDFEGAYVKLVFLSERDLGFLGRHSLKYSVDATLTTPEGRGLFMYKFTSHLCDGAHPQLGYCWWEVLPSTRLFQ